MYNYIITLDNKKEKSSFLNKLDFFNKMVKNLFNTVFYDASGKIYSSNFATLNFWIILRRLSASLLIS